MKEKLIAELDQTAKDMLQVLSNFREDEFNVTPEPGKWSAGQMTDHVLQSVNGMYYMLTGPSKKTNRAPDQKFPTFKSIFLDFSTQLKSPEFILPKKTAYNQSEILQSLENKFNAITSAAKTVDLTEACKDEIPGFGETTKMEILYFLTVHSQRHIQQAKRIYSKVTSGN